MHRLNLVVNDLIEDSPLATNVINICSLIYTLFNAPKVRLHYEKIFKDKHPKGSTQYITQQFKIRWGCKFEVIDFLKLKLDVVLKVLTDVAIGDEAASNFDKKHQDSAATIYHKIACGKFLIALTSLHGYLYKLYLLNKELHAEKIDWTNVKYEVTRTKTAIDKISDDCLLNSAKELADSVGVPLTLSMPIQRTRSQSDSDIGTSQVKHSIAMLNSSLKSTLKREFAVRFDNQNIEIL